MSYFFVFQNKTYYDEYRGGYLWAPKYGNSGKTKHFWARMKSLRDGDVIIHSYNKKIMAISIAKGIAYDSTRPNESFNEWQHEGWRVDTKHIPFNDTILTSDYKEDLIRIKPNKYAAFDKNGSGTTGYLFDANREMFEFFINKIAGVQKNDDERSRVISLLKY